VAARPGWSFSRRPPGLLCRYCDRPRLGTAGSFEEVNDAVLMAGGLSANRASLCGALRVLGPTEVATMEPVRLRRAAAKGLRLNARTPGGHRCSGRSVQPVLASVPDRGRGAGRSQQRPNVGRFGGQTVSQPDPAPIPRKPRKQGRKLYPHFPADYGRWPLNSPRIRQARRWPGSGRRGSLSPSVYALLQRGSSPAGSARVVWRICLVIFRRMVRPLRRGTGVAGEPHPHPCQGQGCVRRLIPGRRFVLPSCSARPAHGIIEGEQAIARRVE
jgi:hypothetical protein